MSMKKLIAGFAAASLAVTSLATVASAADFAEFAHFDGVPVGTIDYYNVTVSLGGTLAAVAEGKGGALDDVQADPTSADANISLNLATSYDLVTTGLGVDFTSPTGNDYFYVDYNNNDTWAARVYDIALQFYYKGTLITVPGLDNEDGTTVWGYVKADASDSSAGSALAADHTTLTAKQLLDFYSADDITTDGHVDNAGVLLTGIPLENARITYKQEIWGADIDANTKNITLNVWWGPDWDLSSDIKTRDLVSYPGYGDIEVGNQNVVATLSDDVSLVQQSTQEAVGKTGPISLSVRRTLYTADPVYIYDGGITNTLFFHTEDVTVGGGGVTSGSDASTNAGVTHYRLNATQQADGRNLNGDMHVTLVFHGKTTKAGTIKVQTDLMRWRKEAAMEVDIANDANSVTFDMPAKAFFDADYRVGYSSGFLANFTINTGDLPFTTSQTGVAANKVVEAIFEYDPADVGTGASGETPAGPDAGSDEPNADDIYSVSGGEPGAGVVVSGTWKAIYGNGAKNFGCVAKVTDTDVDYKLTLTDADGNPVQPAGEVTLKLDIPAAGQGKTLTKNTVTHTLNDGSIEELPIQNWDTYKTDKFLIVKTTKFSSFGFAWEDDGDADNGNTDDGNTDGGDNGDTNGGNTDDKNVGTGVALFAVPTLAAAAGVLVFKKRK